MSRPSRPRVYGAAVDEQTRCVHWHSALDVIAVRFACCGRFYPCDACHAADADHPTRVWTLAERDEPTVLCGVCGTVMSTATYLASDDRCPACATAFNPGCRLHHDRYFQV